MGRLSSTPNSAEKYATRKRLLVAVLAGPPAGRVRARRRARRGRPRSRRRAPGRRRSGRAPRRRAPPAVPSGCARPLPRVSDRGARRASAPRRFQLNQRLPAISASERSTCERESVVADTAANDGETGGAIRRRRWLSSPAIEQVSAAPARFALTARAELRGRVKEKPSMTTSAFLRVLRPLVAVGFLVGLRPGACRLGARGATRRSYSPPASTRARIRSGDARGERRRAPLRADVHRAGPAAAVRRRLLPVARLQRRARRRQAKHLPADCPTRAARARAR